MNGFEKHGIKHLSASSINLWKNAPDVWVMSYLCKKRTPGSPAMWRGICAEDLTVMTLSGVAFDDALTIALDKFDKQYPIALDEAVTKERSNIEPMSKQAVLALEHLGKPDFETGTLVNPFPQEKIQIRAAGEGYEIPVIGFLDIVYPEHGLVIDLKTTNRVPSSMSDDHQLQRAIYQKAKGNSAVKFLYVSAKKSALLEDGDPSEVLAKAKTQITRLERFLRKVDDAADAIGIVPHNPSSFYWRGAETLRDELFN